VLPTYVGQSRLLGILQFVERGIEGGGGDARLGGRRAELGHRCTVEASRVQFARAGEQVRGDWLGQNLAVKADSMAVMHGYLRAKDGRTRRATLRR
jgi:hypothetical protein